MPDPSHRPYQPIMTIIRPHDKPRLWWLFPWSYARTLNTAANALRALTDRQERALDMQAHIIVDQSEEIANLRQEVTRLAGSRDHWIKKHDQAYAVAMHNERVILDMEKPLEWLPIESAPKDGSYFIGGVWGDMDSRPTWAAMCNYYEPFKRFEMQETNDQPDFWLPLPKAPKEVQS